MFLTAKYREGVFSMDFESIQAAISRYPRQALKRLCPPDGEDGQVTVENIIWIFIVAVIALAIFSYILYTKVPQVKKAVDAVITG